MNAKLIAPLNKIKKFIYSLFINLKDQCWVYSLLQLIADLRNHFFLLFRPESGDRITGQEVPQN